jgi:sulfur-oxidizing protein SoxY
LNEKCGEKARTEEHHAAQCAFQCVFALWRVSAPEAGEVATVTRNLAIAFLLVSPLAFAVDDALTSGAWQNLRTQFYGTHAIGEVDENLMSMAAPGATPDPTATPVTLHFGPQAAGKVKQVRVIIDHNPAPIAATMQLAQGVPIEDIELRLRIDRATNVRAIAELADGGLEMRSVWINAGGGCSAPPSASGTGLIGDIRFRPSPDQKSMQVSIHHPNNSGFQIDPVTGEPIPPHFVSHIRLRSGDKIVFEADTGIAISENPTIRIASEDKIAAPLTLEAVDSTAAQFSATWGGKAAKAGGG